MGTFTIMKEKASILNILNDPITMYSWKAAENKNVMNLAVPEFMPLLIIG
jgi:hypothetical protein